jgi:MYXO-CTERM domain-containing protein
MAVLSAAGLAAAAFAQPVTQNPAGYQYEFRIIADGDAGAPTSLPVSQRFNRSQTATQIGFWIQARVAQTINENWGIVRVSAPAAPNTSFISMNDPANSADLNRGGVNNTGSVRGRGIGYQTGGANNSATANLAGSAAFPGVTLNENGALDGSGGHLNRIYSFDAYVDGTRVDPDADSDGDRDDDGDGFAENPWGVNGATHAGDISGTPLASDGQFSPWANIYRFYVLPTGVNTQRTITLDAYAQIQGAIQAAPTQTGSSSFAMQVGPGRSMFAQQYSFVWGNVPTPGAASLMGLGMLAAARRRR